jgi:predicted DNA-binding transcriptional regulator YafY
MDVLDEGFEVPADFNPSEYARSAFGISGGEAQTVELLFGPSMASYIRERTWHESQQLEEEEDGSVRLTMDVALGFELKAWIKGFLPDVRVVRPTALRDDIGRDLAEARSGFAVRGNGKEPPPGPR